MRAAGQFHHHRIFLLQHFDAEEHRAASFWISGGICSRTFQRSEQACGRGDARFRGLHRRQFGRFQHVAEMQVSVLGEEPQLLFVQGVRVAFGFNGGCNGRVFHGGNSSCLGLLHG